ncbi:MAG: pyrroline-5-carboxylate reductase [Opitutales bacterium]
MKIGFIGAGRMAKAIAKGLLAKGFEADEVGCVSGSGSSARALSEETGVRFYEDVESLAKDASIWVLALKPFQLDDLPESLVKLSDGKLILSVLAGVKLEKLKLKFPNARNWVRTMPNTPSQIGAGVTGLSFANHPSAEDASIVDKMLSAVGRTVEIPEAQMDALTAVSGSGVAYVFEWAAGMMEAAVSLGLSPEDAKILTLDTFSGASALMQAQSEIHPEALRDAVVSKGGTTEAALSVFEANKTRTIIADAMTAAAERSKELSK